MLISVKKLFLRKTKTMKKVLLFILFPFFLYGQTQIGQDIEGKLIGNNSYRSVSLSENGNVLAVSTSLDSGNFYNSGKVRIYENISDKWLQIGQTIEGESTSDYFGERISISKDGSTIAISSFVTGFYGKVKVFKNISGVWTQIGETFIGESIYDNLGASFQLNADGTILAIGESGNDSNGKDSGRVRVFKYTSGIWVQIGKSLKGKGLNHSFGSSLSMSSDGTIIAIGAPTYLVAKGKVSIYKFDSVNWVQIGGDFNGVSGQDLLGRSISLSSDGKTIAIFYRETKKVFLFKYETDLWTQVGQGINIEIDSNLIEKISLNEDGTIIALGSIINNINGKNTGQTQVFKFNNDHNNWLQLGESINGDKEGDDFGNSLSLSSDGSVLAIGAKSNSIKGELSKNVIVVKKELDNWVQVGENISDGGLISDLTGQKLSVNSTGNIIAIGVENSDENGQNSGQVRIYENKNGTWSQIGNSIDGDLPHKYFGSSVSLNSIGNIIAIGTKYGNLDSTDQVRVYENKNGVWTQLGESINGDISDLFGSSVSLNSVGNIVAIGAPFKSGSLFGIGQAKIYKNINGIWSQIGDDINGIENTDFLGTSVSLNSAGNIVAIGATRSDGINSKTGKVFIYENNNGNWSQNGDITGKEIGDRFGATVNLNSVGDILIVKALYNSNLNNSGYVSVFKNDAGSWLQIGNDIKNKAEENAFTSSVSINSDGNIIAIGELVNDENIVNIYQNIENNWELKTSIKEKNNQFGISFSTKLNSKGNIVAIGYPNYEKGKVKVYDLSAILFSDSFVLSKFNIFPNPAKNIVNIELIDNLILHNINIYNNLGQLLKSSKELIINTSNLSKGIYFVQVETDKGKATKKLIIE